MMTARARIPSSLTLRRGLAALILAACLVAPASARASDDFPGGIVYLYYIGVIGIPLAGGATTVIGNGVSLGVSRRPSLGWIVPGFVFGTWNLAMGIFWMSVPSIDRGAGTYSMSTVHFALAAADIILSSLCLRQRLRLRAPWSAPPSPRLSLAPLLAPTGNGGVRLGLGLQLSGW